MTHNLHTCRYRKPDASTSTWKPLCSSTTSQRTTCLTGLPLAPGSHGLFENCVKSWVPRNAAADSLQQMCENRNTRAAQRKAHRWIVHKRVTTAAVVLQPQVCHRKSPADGSPETLQVRQLGGRRPAVMHVMPPEGGQDLICGQRNQLRVTPAHTAFEGRTTLPRRASPVQTV